MLLPLPSACYNMFSIEMINPNYMTHLDHVVRIIITCPLLPEKMQPESVAAQWIPGFSKEIVKFPLAALVQIFPR